MSPVTQEVANGVHAVAPQAAAKAGGKIQETITDLPALGRLEDLPQDYRDDLTKLNLVPLWPSLRAVLPPGVPSRRTQATAWAYTDIRPLLLKAGELTPMEKAERRVLVLANPGRGLENMQASPSIYLGMQLLLPGEFAPAHRHTPNAVRMVVEGKGAYTVVAGEKCPMERGDLILTPTGQWHEHEHAGSEPVVWLDVLDLPLVYYAEASYVIEGSRQGHTAKRGDKLYARGGVLPTPAFRRAADPYPMLRYPWAEAKAALLALAETGEERVQVSYVNPETGAPCENNLRFGAMMLRPGQQLTLPVRSTAQVFHAIEGAASVQVDGRDFALATADTACAPGYADIALSNASATEPAFVFVADEEPIQKKMGVYEERGFEAGVPNMPTSCSW
ncbi:gentisate 1,2-dioxygenase [Hyaloraphidium curvatum]|nr:gentisate 1,2-dioxygenase [Hyaloraphidium curvatum]